MTFNPIAEPVDVVYVMGKPSPGIATVSGAALKRRWDERQAYGTEGSTLRGGGRELAKFTVTLTLIDEEDFRAWAEWRRLLVPRPPTDPNAQSRALGRRSVDEAVTARAFAANATTSAALGDPVAAQTFSAEAQAADRRSREFAARARSVASSSGPRELALEISHPQLEALGISRVVLDELGQEEQRGDGEWIVPIKFIEYREPRRRIARADGSAATPNTEGARDAFDLEIEALSNQAEALL